MVQVAGLGPRTIVQTHTDVRAHPSSGGVTQATNLKSQDADIHRKIKLWGVIEAFRDGKLPDNNQIENALAYAQTNSSIDLSKLSADGQKLVDDIRDIIGTMREIVTTKNPDQLIQEAIWESELLDLSNAKQGNIAPTDKQKVHNDAQEAAKNLRVLATLFVSNGEVRKLVSDLDVIGRELLSESATQVASSAMPSQDQLNQVDKPAPDNTWVGPDGKQLGPNDSPVQAAKQHAKSSAAQSSQDTAQGGGQTTQADPQAHDATNKAHGRMQQMRDKIPEAHRQRAHAAWDDTRGMVEDAFPQERRDQFIWRLKKALGEIQQNKDYNEAMSWLLDTASKYNSHAKHLATKTHDAHQDASTKTNASNVISMYLTIFERFANGKSLKPVEKAADQLYDDARNDKDLHHWWSTVDDYVHRVLLEPGYIMEDECAKEGSQLKKSANTWYGPNGKYKPHWDHLWDELSSWFKSFHEDKLNHQFGQDWARLTKSLVADDDGKFTFKPQLWRDIRHVILPEAIRQIGYIPIPRAEFIDDKLDLVVENLVLSGPNLFPNIIDFESQHKFRFSPLDSISDQSYHRIQISMSQIQADLRDVRFAFRKKTGFPRLKDHGLADVTISRQGITVEVEIETVDRHDSMFGVRSVQTKIDELSFKIRESKHDLLYKFIKPAATKVIKNAIANAVEGAIRSALDYVDQELVTVRNRMSESKDADETTRRQTIKEMYVRKTTIADDNADKAKKADKVKQGEARSEFNIVVNRKDAQLNDLTAPDSITERVWKAEDAAHLGTGWKSPAFDVVSPQPRAVAGRPHHAATAGNTPTSVGSGGAAGTTGQHSSHTGAAVAGGAAAVAGAAGSPAHRQTDSSRPTTFPPTSQAHTQHAGATAATGATGATGQTSTGTAGQQHSTGAGLAAGAATGAAAGTVPSAVHAARSGTGVGQGQTTTGQQTSGQTGTAGTGTQHSSTGAVGSTGTATTGAIPAGYDGTPQSAGHTTSSTTGGPGQTTSSSMPGAYNTASTQSSGGGGVPVPVQTGAGAGQTAAAGTPSSPTASGPPQARQ